MVKDRFEKAFNHLKGTGQIKTQRAAANIIGVDPSNLSNALKGDTKYLTNNLLERFNAAFGNIFNLDWLLTGEGEMLKDTPKEKKDIYLITKSGTKYYELPNGSFKMIVPFVPIKAYAGYVDECRDAEFIEQLEEREFHVKEIHLGKYYSFEIKGDSMDDNSRDSLINGDVVLARDLGRIHWKSLKYKEVKAWIIVLKNTIVCKEIVSVNLKEGTFRCHSLNTSPEYSDFDIKFDDTVQLMNIVKRESDY